MPKIVDHDERRRDIIEAAWRVIARGGLAHTTTRQIAREAGCSQGVLAHYFADRADILSSALVAAHRGVRERTDRRITGLRGLGALRLLLTEALPLNEQAVLEARIEVSFWGEAVADEVLRDIRNSEVDEFSGRIRKLVEQAVQDGELPAGADVGQVLDECLTLVDGLSIQAVMYPARATPQRQLAMLDDLLERHRT